MFRHRTAAFLVCIALLPCACARHGNTPDTGATAPDAGGDVALPKPQANGGSVTGMPATPGPNPVGPALAASEDADANPDANADADATGDQGGDDTTDANVDGTTAGGESDGDTAVVVNEPSAQDAVATLRGYYAAINQHDYQRAWSSWSDGGRSSGQTLQQFADGFANTAQVALQAGVPGAVEGAAGSRYIEIPVTIDATQRDGSVHHYVGSYTLRRAVVDGATDAQRAWHIASASLHEAGQ